MDFDRATPDELRQASYEMQRQAQETGRRFNWAERQQADNGRRPTIPVPLGAGSSIDWAEAALTRKRAQARRELTTALEESGLAARWRADDERARKSAEGERELERYFSSLEGSGALGGLLSNKNTMLWVSDKS
jgi:hypothetical protein